MREVAQASFVSGSLTGPFCSSFLVHGQKQMQDLRLASFGAGDACSLIDTKVKRVSHLRHGKRSSLVPVWGPRGAVTELKPLLTLHPRSSGQITWTVKVTRLWPARRLPRARNTGLWTTFQTPGRLQRHLTLNLKDTIPFYFEIKLQIPFRDRKWLIRLWSSTQKITNIWAVLYSFKTISYLYILRKVWSPLISEETESLTNLVKFHRQNKIKEATSQKMEKNHNFFQVKNSAKIIFWMQEMRTKVLWQM